MVTHSSERSLAGDRISRAARLRFRNRGSLTRLALARTALRVRRRGGYDAFRNPFFHEFGYRNLYKRGFL